MTCRTCWSLAAALVLLSAGVVYKFVVRGSVAPSVDERTTILLEPSERDLVLAEMRLFLEGVQRISDGIAKGDMKQVAVHARRSGHEAQMAVPGALIGKLPLSFKRLGFDTHTKFSELALDAEQFGDRERSLSQLNVLLNNCVVCHAAWRFDQTRG